MVVLAFVLPGASWLGALALALLVVSLPASWPLQRLRVELASPFTLHEGEAVQRVLTLEHRGLLPLCGVEVFARARRLQGRAVLPVLTAGARAEAVLHLRGLGRGPVRSLRLQLETSAPLGLLLHRRVLTLDVDVLVLPRPAAVSARRVDRLSAPRERAMVLTSEDRRHEEEFYALREFRSGDREVRVHPRLSARRGRKVWTEWRGGARQELRLFLDVRVPARGGGRGAQEFEMAIRALAGLLRHWLQQGRRVSLYALGESECRLLVGANQTSWYPFLVELARLERDRRRPGECFELCWNAAPEGGERMLWQHGCADSSSLPADVHTMPPAEEWLR